MGTGFRGTWLAGHQRVLTTGDPRNESEYLTLSSDNCRSVSESAVGGKTRA